MTKPKRASDRSGKPFVIIAPRKNGKLIHDEAVHALCRCCGRPLTADTAYCSPEHEAAHQRLT